MNEAFNLYDFLCYFLIYSFLGWCVEVIYHALTFGKVINRGFLNGPVCPIYGFGMVAILGFFDHFLKTDVQNGNAIGLFIGGVIITTAIELFGGWILDKLFHVRWWDYSDKPFNLHGYICPEFSLYWGLGVVFIYRIVHPVIADVTVGLIPHDIGVILLAVLYLIMLVDLIVTVSILIGLNKRLKELDSLRADMRKISDELTGRIAEGAIKNANIIEKTRVQMSLAGMETRDELSDRIESGREEILRRKNAAAARYEELRSKVYKHKTFGITRLVKSFPSSSHEKYGELFDIIKKTVNEGK